MTEPLPLRYGFSVGPPVPHSSQRRLLELGREVGEPSTGVYAGQGAPFWIWATLRNPAPASLPPSVVEYFARRPASDYDTWAYFSRLDRTLEWEWLPDPASELVQELLRPLAGLWRKLTRVKLLLHIPGEALKAHRDLVPGNYYDDLRSEFEHGWGSRRLMYRGLPWLEEAKPFASGSHRDNLYLSMKIPLSERPGSPGAPFLELAGRKHRYTSDDRIFFLNEAEMTHGADPVDYWRGVVFVNGFWNLAALERAPKAHLRLLD